MAQVLPGIISNNQAGFVRGRSITENVLLAQKIIRDISLRNKNTNVVVKLTWQRLNYDRVSWIFLSKVMRGFGFSEVIIDMIWRLLSNSWYSVLIAGEVLSRGLNGLHRDTQYKGYGLPKWSQN